MPGYKQTEFGVIPEDWVVVNLGTLYGFKNGLNKAKKFFGYGTPIINYMDVYTKRGLRMKDIAGKVSLSPHEIDNYRILLGDVLFTRTSETAEEVGISSVVLDELDDTVFSGFVLRARPKTKKMLPQFAQYCFSPTYVRKQIIAKSTYTTRALTNGRSLSTVNIAIPSSNIEQINIAISICDIDQLITALEKLIEKKKLIKQGVMQELLTGKRRLPGFSGDWETKRLGDLFSLQYGKPMKESDRAESGEIPVYGSNGEVGYTYAELTSCPTIIIGRKGAAGSVHHSPTGCWPIDTTFYIEFDDCSESLFYYYLLKEAGLDRIKSDSAVPGLNRSDAYALNVLVPSGEERKQIAEILSSIDKEITCLSNSLDKHKLLKQGMMQELLTGRIRFI